MTHLLSLCGSQRTGSANARLLDELAAYVPANYSHDRLLPGEVKLPLFDQDIERNPDILAQLRQVYDRFARADALIIASPEYNGMMTPYLKNLIDWVSRLSRLDPAVSNPFLDRPVLLCSATPGFSGGALGLMSMRGLLGHVGAISFGETICLPFAGQAWEEGGSLNPMLRDAGWEECVARFCAFAATRELRRAA